MGPVPEGRHMFVFQVFKIKIYVWIWFINQKKILLGQPSQPWEDPRGRPGGGHSCPPHLQLQISGSVGQCNIGGLSWNITHFQRFRIHPDWLLCEQWLPGPGVEGEQPLAPAVGQAAEEHPGHQSQVSVAQIMKETLRTPLLKIIHYFFVIPELRSSR